MTTPVAPAPLIVLITLVTVPRRPVDPAALPWSAA